jgi:hypothetical protein
MKLLEIKTVADLKKYAEECRKHFPLTETVKTPELSVETASGMLDFSLLSDEEKDMYVANFVVGCLTTEVNALVSKYKDNIAVLNIKVSEVVLTCPTVQAIVGHKSLGDDSLV